MNRKILVFGASGMLGSYLSRYFEDKGYEVVRSDRNSEENAMNITDEEQLKKFVKDTKPDFVINCAAYTNVNQAESEPEIAEAVNAIAPKYMAEISKELKIPFIHISTNEVFGNGAYDEESREFNPLNEYAKSKLAGEMNIEEVGSTNYIFRTSWLYGPGAKNFIRFVTDTEGPLRIVTDEKGCPTYVGYLTERVQDAVESKIVPGIYHVSSCDILSRYEFAQEILQSQNIEKGMEKVEKKDLPPRPVVSPSNQLINTKLPEAPTSREMLDEYVIELVQWDDFSEKNR